MLNTFLSMFFDRVLVPFTNICLRFVNQRKKKKGMLIKNDSTTQAERIKVLCYCITVSLTLGACFFSFIVTMEEVLFVK